MQDIIFQRRHFLQFNTIINRFSINLVVNGNLNMIVTEDTRDLLNTAFELDGIKGSKIKHLKSTSYHCFNDFG